MFAILQKYDFSSKSQHANVCYSIRASCLRYCKSTIFQANHNTNALICCSVRVVCDTAKVRFFKQITTPTAHVYSTRWLFAILQKYDFSSKSQLTHLEVTTILSCLRYCKSTIFQANHNLTPMFVLSWMLFAILQKYDFSSKSQRKAAVRILSNSCLRYCKSTIFQANHNVPC